MLRTTLYRVAVMSVPALFWFAYAFLAIWLYWEAASWVAAVAFGMR